MENVCILHCEIQSQKVLDVKSYEGVCVDVKSYEGVYAFDGTRKYYIYRVKILFRDGEIDLLMNSEKDCCAVVSPSYENIPSFRESIIDSGVLIDSVDIIAVYKMGLLIKFYGKKKMKVTDRSKGEIITESIPDMYDLLIPLHSSHNCYYSTNIELDCTAFGYKKSVDLKSCCEEDSVVKSCLKEDSIM